MRTTLDIDDTLLDALMTRLPESSKTEAIEEAIASYVRQDAIDELIKMRGKVKIDDVSAELRAIDRKA